MTEFCEETIEKIAWVLSQVDPRQGYRSLCRRAFRSSPEFAEDYRKLETIERRLGEWEPLMALEKWQNAAETIGEVLELRPEEREDAVRAGDDEDFHTAAFIWRLLDREADLRFEDREASAHFARLAQAASDGWIAAEGLRFGHKHASTATDLYALSTTVLGNHARIAGDLDRAATLLATAEGYLRRDSDQWVAGVVYSFKGSLLDNQGETERSHELLSRAARLFKGVDEIRRCEVTIQKALSLFGLARNPERLLEAVIRVLEREPRRSPRTLGIARINLLLAKLYLGQPAEQLRRLWNQIPPFEDGILELSRQQAGAFLEGTAGHLNRAKAILSAVANEFDSLGFLTHGAVSRLYYAMACLASGESYLAEQSALEAFSALAESKFRSQHIHEAARKVYLDAQRKALTDETLVRLVWTVICPNAQPDEIDWPGVRLKATA